MMFSVIIPTYNRSPLLREAIDSVLDQSLKDYEVIVVNDGSSDDTKNLLKSYGEKIIAINKNNEGAEKARNTGSNIAKGEYLAFLDDDDIFFPWTLENYNKVILKKNSPELIFGQPHYFKDNLGNLNYQRTENRIEIVTYDDYFSKDRPIFTSCSMMVVRKKIYFECGGFKQWPGKETALDDFNFLLRSGNHGPTAIIFNPKQFGYRNHEDNSVKNLKMILKGVSYLVEAEKRGEFEGGKERKFARYAIIGGPASCWLRKSLLHGIIKDAVRPFFKSFPMIVTGFLKKIRIKLSEKKDLEIIQ